MSIAARIRAGVERCITAEMRRVNYALAAQAPIPASTAPPLEDLTRILAELQERRPRRDIYLRTGS